VLEYFEVVEGVAHYRPAGKVLFQEVTTLASRALAACHESGVRKLLFDTTGLTGFEVPNVLQRFQFCENLARDARGVAVAVVAEQRMIDPGRFGTAIVRNRGAVADFFASEFDARKWLSGAEAPAGQCRISNRKTSNFRDAYEFEG
jgi:hypothetical protein